MLNPVSPEEGSAACQIWIQKNCILCGKFVAALQISANHVLNWKRWPPYMFKGRVWSNATKLVSTTDKSYVCQNCNDLKLQVYLCSTVLGALEMKTRNLHLTIYSALCKFSWQNCGFNEKKEEEEMRRKIEPKIFIVDKKSDKYQEYDFVFCVKLCIMNQLISGHTTFPPI